ncbi:MAG TPA: YqiA/YcfP family alpha/beta fold hydrolase [Vicinamibacterales bacterium]|nr:YqiA/YcfP family alpha/beta fold hydrolase [Vicinamibacterales bacterium]
MHGFASSPQSTKATFFRERLSELGVRMHCPDLNQPDFSTLTISRMLQQLEDGIAALPPGDIFLIGSSLGGFVAVEAAARQVGRGSHPISRVVLLAPAVELEWENWSDLGPQGVPAWRQNGEVEIFHYAYDEPRQLRFGFYEDAARYHAAARRLEQPLLIFQGRADESVNPAVVQKFAMAQPSAILHMLDDDHQLKKSLPFIWEETAKFLS